MRIAIIAAGEMGSGVGARLHAKGAEVMTSLVGRGSGSAERARRASMIAIGEDEATALLERGTEGGLRRHAVGASIDQAIPDAGIVRP